MCIHIGEYATNEEVIRTAGIEQLQAIVTTGRRKMAGHILRLQRERPAYTSMYWVPEDGRKEGGGERRRLGEIHSKKTWPRWVSAGMEPAGSPMTVRDGDLSSPDAPRGTGGTKSR